MQGRQFEPRQSGEPFWPVRLHGGRRFAHRHAVIAPVFHVERIALGDRRPELGTQSGQIARGHGVGDTLDQHGELGRCLEAQGVVGIVTCQCQQLLRGQQRQQQRGCAYRSQGAALGTEFFEQGVAAETRLGGEGGHIREIGSRAES